MSNLTAIPGNADPVVVLSATGTGPSTITFLHDTGGEDSYPGPLFPAVFEFAITDIIGVFSSLQINLEWSPITATGTPQFQTIGSWSPLTGPVTYFPCSATGAYRLNCTSFSGGTSFNVYASIASTMPQGSSGGGGGGSVTQGTVPWIDNIVQVAGVALGATAVVAFGSMPAAVAVPAVNAFVTNAGSIGGGVQYADNAASGATPTGTLDMGWDSANSKVRALKVDASQNLLVALGAPLPAGTAVIGHVIVDSGAITVSGSVMAAQGSPNTLANAWPIEITDGTNGPVAVKAGNTAAGGGDPALVVAQSPSSPLLAQQWGAGAGPFSQIPFTALSLDSGAKNALAVAIVDNNGAQMGYSISNPIYIATTGYNGVFQALVSLNSSGLNNALDENILTIRGTLPTQAGYLDVKISDGTHGTVAVKPASTAALAADPSIVVALSPNSPLPAGTNVIGHTIVDSGSVTVSGSISFTAPQHVIVDSGSVAVSGTVTANQGAANATPWNENVAQIGGTAAPAPTAKGTQGSSGIPVQDLKDAGRTYITLYAQLITGVTTEALATFTKNVNGTTTTGQTAYTITNGKTFRIQALSVQINDSTTVANNISVNVRVAASVAASSPIVFSCGASSPVAIATAKGFATNYVPDGIDIAGNGSIEIGISHLENVTTASIASFTLVGYEY